LTHLDNTAETALSRPQNDSDALGHLPCYSIPTPRWACVYTHPQAERWASDNLTRIGFQTYLPLYLVSRPDRATPSILHHVLVPLFSRYLFLQFDHRAESWSPIRAAPGVSDLVRCGADVHYASAGAVEALQATEALRATRLPEIASWAPGTPCSLGKGIMAGHPAVVLAVSHSSARVGLMFLGEMRTFRVPVEYLTPRAC
jgi:transcriptional antiterminator RfaH